MNNLNIKYSKANQITNFKLLRKIIKESYLFIIFWFINGMIPICVCLISALIKKYGAYYVIGIGYITAFQLAYVQIGWVISIAVLLIIHKIKITDKISNADYGEILFNAILIISTFSFILIILFLVPTVVYTKFANNHTNTIFSQKIGYMYILGLLPYIFLNPFISLFIIDIHICKGNKYSIPLLIITNLVIISITIASIYIPTSNYELIGMLIGLGMSIGSFISLIALLILAILIGSFKYFKWRFNSKKYRFIFKSIFNQMTSILSIQIIKAIGLFVLGIVITDTINSIVPMGYQLSRVVWYNYLYLIPFFAYGIGDIIIFIGLRKRVEIKKENLLINLLILAFLSLIIEFIISIGLYYTIKPLSSVYIKNYQINWNYIDINTVNLQFVLNQLAKKFNLSNDKINQILYLANSSPLIDRIVKVSLITMLSLNNMNQIGIANYLILPESKSYIYISAFSTMYPIAIIFANYGFVLKKRYQNWKETTILIALQSIVIGSIITMGVKFQSSTQLPYLDAWSFLFVIVGPGSLILYLTRFLIEYKKINKNHVIGNNVYHKIVLNKWNNTKEKIYAY